jgi:hypothetical protein
MEIVRFVAGAAAGGFVGYHAFFWIVKQGFYALMLPGMLLGFGGGIGAVRRSRRRGGLCAAVAVALGLLAEWRLRPFIKDHSLTFFLTHVADLRPVTWLMIILGGVLAYWSGQGRDR